MRALVIETAFLGDAIIALSLARELKRLQPECNITYLVRPDAVEIIRASPDVDRVIAFDKRGTESGLAGIRKKSDELNAEGFDVLFLLHGSRRSQMLSAMLKIAVKAGFAGSDRTGLTHVAEDSGWTTRYERAILPLQAVYPESDISTLPQIHSAAPKLVQEFCKRFQTVITLAPGSAWNTKKWGDEKYAELAKRLTDRGVGVLVIGGEDAGCAGALIRAACAPDSVLDLTARITLVEAVGAISASSLLVANDRGPTHLAVAVGTRVITIFGPTIPAFGFGPPKSSGEVIELPGLWCRPCTAHGSDGCPVYTHECMRGISVEDVFTAVWHKWIILPFDRVVLL